jgi:hypothetical protein
MQKHHAMELPQHGTISEEVEEKEKMEKEMRKWTKKRMGEYASTYHSLVELSPS